MDATLAGILGTAISLAGGVVTKKLSKLRSSVVHEWAAPAAAVGAGIAFRAVTGADLDFHSLLAGAGTGANAVLLHSLYYGAVKGRAG